MQQSCTARCAHITAPQADGRPARADASVRCSLASTIFPSACLGNSLGSGVNLGQQFLVQKVDTESGVGVKHYLALSSLEHLSVRI